MKDKNVPGNEFRQLHALCVIPVTSLDLCSRQEGKETAVGDSYTSFTLQQDLTACLRV